MGVVEWVFIGIASLIFLLLIAVYLLQQRKQPLETIQESLSDRLGVADLIGFSLVTLTKEKEDLSGAFYVACLVPGLILIGILVLLVSTEDPISDWWIPGPLQPVALGLLFLLLYVGGIAWFAGKISDTRRITPCYMCVSKSEGIVFVPVRFWSRDLVPVTPQIKDGSISPTIPLDAACEIQHLPKGQEGLSEGPIYYFANRGIGVSASKHWSEQLENLVEKVTSHVEERRHLEEADSVIRSQSGSFRELISPESESSGESQIIRPTGAQIAKGIGGLLCAAGTVLGGFAAVNPRPPFTNGVEWGMFLGGMAAVLVVSYLFVRRSLKHFKTIIVDDMLKELDSRDNSERQKAAKTLVDRKWEPVDATQELKLLVASQKYEEALSFDPMAAERMVDTLTLKYVSDGEAILKAFVDTNCQTAVSPLIELLVKEKTAVSKRQIVRTLKRLTGQNIGVNYDQWKTWLTNKDELY